MQTSTPNIAVITMVYNESYNLPSWVKHYRAQCPGCELFIIDHGSNEPVRDNFSGVNVLTIPRSEFDERRRADFVSRLHNALLLEFDWVVYTDCDELVISQHHDTVAEALENEDSKILSINAIGLNMWHNVDADEHALDRSRPMGEQRKFATFEKSMCKPFASRVPIHWIPGFHTSNLRPCFADGGYFLVHTKYIDLNEASQRLALTSALDWSEEALQKGWSGHQRIDDDVQLKRFKGISALIKDGKTSVFEFGDESRRYVDESVEDSKGNWRSDAVYEGKVVEIPGEILSKLP